MLIDEIKKAKMVAMREKDTSARAVYDIVVNKYLLQSISLRESGKEITDADMIQIIMKTIKELADEKENFLKAGREETAKYITENLDIPTIGIGGGKYCSGQVLVTDDMLGKFSDYTPKFVRKYANLRDIITKAVQNYCEDVRNGSFPKEDEVIHAATYN